MARNLTIDTDLIENGTLTYEMVLVCLAAIEKLINRYAYQCKKFKYTDECFNGANKNNLNKYIQYRTLLSKSIYPKYRIDDIKGLIKSEYVGAKCSEKTIDDVVVVIKSGKYTLSS